MDPFEIPTDVTTIEDLAAAEAAALEAAEAITALDDPTDEQLEQLERIADHIEALRNEAVRRDEEAQGRRERAERARARIAPPEDSEQPAEGDEGDEGTEEEGSEEGSSDDEGSEEGEVEARQPEAVAAAGKRRAPSLVRRTKAPANPRPSDSGSSSVVITASAGIPKVEAGSQLSDLSAVTEAFMARSKSHPNAFAPNIYARHSVATFSRGDFGGLSTDNPEYRDDHQAMLDAAGKESRLQGNSLAAAGGWCAPSETLYDLVEMESASGLIDLPEVGINRGGIRFTTGPDFSDIYAGVGFSQTEAQAIAGTVKTCYEVDCPPFEEVRLDAVGICVKAPLLTNSAYPELVQRVLRGSMIAHLHKVSVRMINSLVTELGAANVLPASGSVARSTLTGLELAAEGQRAAFRMDLNATMEVVLPHWSRVVLRDDLQARLRQDNPVTDAQLDAHFAARKLRVQFVYGFGDARIIAVPGGGTLLTDFPDTMPAMLYPAGTFVKGTADVISLDTVYDTTDLQSNVYTAAFVEEGVLVARRAPGGGNLTIPVVSKGSVGPADLVNYGIADV